MTEALQSIHVDDWGEAGFVVKANEFLRYGRLRFEASVHNPAVYRIRRHLSKNGVGSTRLRDAGYDVWVPGRYKRIPAEDGVIYRDSADLFEVSPLLTKRFAECGFGDQYGGRVRSGWILVASSGQVYGIIGSATLATEALEGQVVSNHVIRISPREGAAMRAGYLVTALSHGTWGRPLLKSLAFGSSVPEIDPNDLADLDVVRLSPENENAIADLAETSAALRAKADLKEAFLGDAASSIIERFINT